jgi:hypothetical protein
VNNFTIIIDTDEVEDVEVANEVEVHVLFTFYYLNKPGP